MEMHNISRERDKTEMVCYFILQLQFVEVFPVHPTWIWSIYHVQYVQNKDDYLLGYFYFCNTEI